MRVLDIRSPNLAYKYMDGNIAIVMSGRLNATSTRGH